MRLLKSKKFELPSLYFITDRADIKDIPIGAPFIYGAKEDEPYLVKLLEYEILYKKAMQSGMQLNFKRILQDEGYELEAYDWCETAYIAHTTDLGVDFDIDKAISDTDAEVVNVSSNLLKQYINDSVAIVDIKKLKDLNVFPLWLDKIEDAVNTNINNFAVFDYNLYNKKLGGMYGNITFNSPGKNLIVVDISQSIPKGVGSTILTMSKNLAESFYADVIITGRRTKFIPYEELHTLNIETAYELYGNGQECKEFRRLLFSERRVYKTAIVFGDYNDIGDCWGDEQCMSDADGKKACLWEVDKLISFHTTETDDVAGYARFFSPNETEKIADWVKYLN